MGPFLLQDGDEDEVQLVQESALVPKALLGTGSLDDEVDDKVADTCILSVRAPKAHGIRHHVP